MKYNLLELTQVVASSMDSDEINSIGDSTESLQIANIIRTVYFDIIGRANLPEHFSVINLISSTDATKPTLMTLPNTVSELKWVKYNGKIQSSDPDMFQIVAKQSLEDFVERMHMINTHDSGTGSFTHTVGPNTFTVYYKNYTPPSYYTTFDDNTILFDSYNSAVETTLQTSNSMCYGKNVIPFSMSDSFTPNLDEEQFPLLLNESKELAWTELKQAQHPIATRNSKRGWAHAQKAKDAIPLQTDFDKLPFFGRRH